MNQKFGPYEIEVDGNHAVISREDGKVSQPTFYEMLMIKNMAFGARCAAVEVYPDVRDLVDGANQRHLWVVEKETVPNLSDGSLVVHSNEKEKEVKEQDCPFELRESSRGGTWIYDKVTGLYWYYSPWKTMYNEGTVGWGSYPGNSYAFHGSRLPDIDDLQDFLKTFFTESSRETEPVLLFERIRKIRNKVWDMRFLAMEEDDLSDEDSEFYSIRVPLCLGEVHVWRYLPKKLSGFNSDIGVWPVMDAWAFNKYHRPQK